MRIPMPTARQREEQHRTSGAAGTKAVVRAVQFAREGFGVIINSAEESVPGMEPKKVDEEVVTAPVEATGGVDPGGGLLAAELPTKPPKPDLAPPKGMEITLTEYMQLGRGLIEYLDGQRVLGAEITEEELAFQYLLLAESEMQTEGDLIDAQRLVQVVINRLIVKDRAVIVIRPSEDPLRPECRVLALNPDLHAEH